MGVLFSEGSPLPLRAPVVDPLCTGAPEAERSQMARCHSDARVFGRGGDTESVLIPSPQTVTLPPPPLVILIEWPRMSQNGPEWPRMSQNGPECLRTSPGTAMSPRPRTCTTTAVRAAGSGGGQALPQAVVVAGSVGSVGGADRVASCVREEQLVRQRDRLRRWRRRRRPTERHHVVSLDLSSGQPNGPSSSGCQLEWVRTGARGAEGVGGGRRQQGLRRRPV